MTIYTSNNSQNIYYVYMYINPNTNIPFYVGYGKNNRHQSHLNEAKRKPTPKQGEHKLNTIRKIIKDGHKPLIQIVDTNLTKEHACELEIFLISEIGRKDLNKGTLTNSTTGGDGNREWSYSAKETMSIRNKEQISVKNKVSGEKFKVHKDDPRWISGELVGQNLGEVNTNCNGKLDKYIQAKDPLTGIAYRVKPDDLRWISGELVGINAGITVNDNVKLAASKTHKGIPKSNQHKNKISEKTKKLKWYFNFELNILTRVIPNTELDGYVMVSGPHKKIPV